MCVCVCVCACVRARVCVSAHVFVVVGSPPLYNLVVVGRNRERHYLYESLCTFVAVVL